MPELVGVRDAAGALGLNPSTVSRYLRQHPELNRGDGTRPLIDVGELRRHRAGHLNQAMTASHAGRLMDETPAPPRSPSGGVPATGFAQARTAHEAIRARIAQIELQQRLDRLVARSEVEDAAMQAARMLRERMLQRSRRIADAVLGLTDAAAIARMIDAEDRTLLLQVSDDLQRRLGQPEDGGPV